MKLNKYNYYEDLIPKNTVTSLLSTKQSDFDLLSKHPSIRPYPIVTMNQVHSNQVMLLQDPISSSGCMPETDAIICNQKQVVLAVKCADCLPILIYHPLKVIAVIHAGRRGTQNNITLNTVLKLKELTGDLSGTHVFFGPAISKPCYPISETENFDLISENTQQLQSASKELRIHYSNICTFKRHNEFYSYRRGDLEKDTGVS